MSDGQDNHNKVSGDGEPAATVEKKDENTPTVPLAALHEARQELKTLKETLKGFEKKEQELQEQKMKEEGQYKELLQEKESKLKELESTATLLQRYEERAKVKIQESLEPLPEEDKEMVLSLLEGKSLLEQEELIPKLTQRLTVKASKNIPPKGSQDQASTDSDELKAQYKKAKEDRNVDAMMRIQTTANMKGIEL